MSLLNTNTIKIQCFYLFWHMIIESQGDPLAFRLVPLALGIFVAFSEISSQLLDWLTWHFVTDIHASQRINDFGDPVTFPPAPPWGDIHDCSIWFMTFPSIPGIPCGIACYHVVLTLHQTWSGAYIKSDFSNMTFQGFSGFNNYFFVTQLRKMSERFHQSLDTVFVLMPDWQMIFEKWSITA